MKKISGKLTVFFENPFWVGIFENIENNKKILGGKSGFKKREFKRIYIEIESKRY